MSEKIKVVIDRAKWRTGQFSKNKTGISYTDLVNHAGYMCCLGFVCQAAGVSYNHLLGVSTPADLSYDVRKGTNLHELLSVHDISKNSMLTKSAMLINDCHATTPAEKEKQLLELFKDSEFELEFTGEYPQKVAENDN
jgi:hypothetical protein